MRSRIFLGILFSILFIATICFYLNKVANAGENHFVNTDNQSPRPTPLCSPSESPTETPSPTPTPKPIIVIVTPPNHNDEGDHLGCSVKDCSGNKIGPPPVDTYPNSPYDNQPVGWK